MTFKPFKVDDKRRGAEIDPVKLFNSLTLRGSVNDLWPPQVDALQKWHAARSKDDVSIEMNTGGGKTLVGLLIAMALTRELGKMVLFASPTTQLVQQTAARASECSIETATYFAGNWTKEDVTASATGPCLTTHQALFNGRSIFRDRELGAIVLDDAHAAGSVIRECFTLGIAKSSPMYAEVIELFRPYFNRSGYQFTFDEVVSGRNRDLLFVPLFESSKHANLIQEVLAKGKVGDATETKFAWAHLKDHLDRCVILINHDRLEIAPACPPTEHTVFFRKGIRRVYLTATLPSPIEFFRTFGVLPDAIRPVGRLGEAQRVFLNAEGSNDEQQRQSAKQLLSDRKALILATSNAVATKWKDCAEQFVTADGHERVESFAKAKPPNKLVMAARYDGVDLPGDACRILVLDGLPRGEALLPRYLNETLHIEVVRAATTAIRFIQAVGRIFRSNTDHGAVVLVGSALLRWVASPANRAYLPSLLQQQLDLAFEIDKKIRNSDFVAADVLSELLNGTKSWDEFYRDNIGQFGTKPPQAPPKWLSDAIKLERAAHEMLWSGDFGGAALIYAQVSLGVAEHDADLAAWDRHFEGYCWERAGKGDLSTAAYIGAANQRGSLGRPKISGTTKPVSVKGTASKQAREIADFAQGRGANALFRAKSVIDDLVLGPLTNHAEQALRDLGELLGLESSRPDKESKKGKGPDVLWLSMDDASGWGFEAKTDKKERSNYTKEDTGQAHEHRQWLKNTHPKRNVELAFVGRVLPVTASASPGAELMVIDLGVIRDLAIRTAVLYDKLTAKAIDADGVQPWLDHLGLAFPRCVSGLQMTLASELQVDDF